VLSQSSLFVVVTEATTEMVELGATVAVAPPFKVGALTVVAANAPEGPPKNITETATIATTALLLFIKETERETARPSVPNIKLVILTTLIITKKVLK
jgi:hypothetical protein